jgi:hypothetical protein
VSASVDNKGGTKMLVRKRRHKKLSLLSEPSSVVADAGEKDISDVSEHSRLSSEFRLRSSVGQSNIKIPNQVILTGSQEIWDVFNTRRDLLAGLGISPDMRVRYFNNNACRAYLLKHYTRDMAIYFDQEENGSYKGDICRTAVLANEGGFYIDLDMQLRTPLKGLVDDATTFMTAKSATSGCLNAIMAAVPKSPVMLRTMEHIRLWYTGEDSHSGQLGTTALQRGITGMMRDSCPEVGWSDAYQQFQCGPDHSIRLFSEQLVDNSDCSRWGKVICPESRAHSDFNGLRYGIFDGRPDGMDTHTSPSAQDILTKEQMLIGWSRFESCKAFGCNLTADSMLDIPDRQS